MANKYLKYDTVQHLINKVASYLKTKVDKREGYDLSKNDFTDILKAKLDGIAENATRVLVDENLSDSSTNAIQNKAVKAGLDTKVDKKDGYALSKNDFTDTLKAKLDGIAEGATNVVVDAELSDSSTNAIQNKAVKAALDTKASLAGATFTGAVKAPTPGSSTNDTTVATTAFVNTFVTETMTGFKNAMYEVVDSLPASGVAGVFYLVPTGDSENQNLYNEYIWVNNKFECLGPRAMDLSGYVQRDEIEFITTDEIDSMFATAMA